MEDIPGQDEYDSTSTEKPTGTQRGTHPRRPTQARAGTPAQGCGATSHGATRPCCGANPYGAAARELRVGQGLPHINRGF